MSENKLVPKLRFSEFTTEWDIKKIQDIANIISGGTPKTNITEYWNGNINWFTPSELKTKYSTESNRKITKEGLNNSSAKLIPKNSIMVSTRATVGELSILKTESTTNQDFESVVPNKNIDNEFIYYALIMLKK